jgi:DNA helicase-2/ATP-dependent DNA helicase PcrA
VRAGMVLFAGDGGFDVVEKIERRRANCTVHDLDVASTHNFIANGIVTHNSIYGWRGARVENILQFERDFPGSRIIRLEQNYRSTSSILNAANAVIARNRGRLGKKLWTEGAQGEPVRLYTAYSDLDEARFVVDRIRRWTDSGRSRRECAILYRSNAQSRVFEQLLMEARLPYRVYGGLRFFERAEIKDALAYLRLMSSRRDDPSFERVVNQPARGIGNRTLEQLREHARAASLTLWEATLDLLARKELAARAASALTGFCATIEQLAEETRGLPLAEQVQAMLDRSGLVAHYKQEKGEKGEGRVENLEELVNAASEYAHEDTEGLDPLTAFLSYAALESGEGQANEWEDSVQLMSLHSAKGLEFPLVFLTGLEEGLFPHERSITEPGRLEEERRLCYVGMTRAMQELYLSHAEVRRWHGRETYTRPSRFLSEIPPELLREVRGGGAAPFARTTARPAAPAKADEDAGLRLGAHVRHRTFGEGVVVHMEGRGDYARIQVHFETGGSKWLVAAAAQLQVL